jgi:hypothetical protein
LGHVVDERLFILVVLKSSGYCDLVCLFLSLIVSLVDPLYVGGFFFDCFLLFDCQSFFDCTLLSDGSFLL